MDEVGKSGEQVQAEQVQETSKVEITPERGIGFSPMPIRGAKPKRTKTFLGIFILAIFVIGGFLIFKDNKSVSVESNPTPSASEEGATPITTPSSTATPKPVDKTKILIEIQNGTGITREAAYLRDLLKSAGYSNFKVGNSEKQDYVTTSLTFSKSTDQAVQDEITAKLGGYYKEVDTKTSATQTVNVVIITGLRKGATAKPTATVTASPSASPSASPIKL